MKTLAIWLSRGRVLRARDSGKYKCLKPVSKYFQGVTRKPERLEGSE